MANYAAALLLSFLLFWQNINAQTAAPVFRQFGLEEGLPSRTTHQFLMDAKGYGWVATTNGLSRYDGYTFLNFNDRNGLSDDVIAAIDHGESGELWVLSLSGKVFFYDGDSLRQAACTRVLQGYKDRFLLPHDIAWSATDSALYIALGALGILKVKPDGSSHSLIRPARKRDLLAINLGKRWIQEFNNYPAVETAAVPESDAGIEIHENGTHTRVAGLRFSTPKIARAGMLPLAGAQYLAYRNGYFYFIKNQEVALVIPFGEVVSDFKIGPDGALWVGLPDKQELRRYESTDALRRGVFQVMLTTSVRGFYFDKNGGLWVASLQEGLFYAVNPGLLAVPQFPGIKIPHISALCPGRQGKVFLGFLNGQQAEIDAKTLGIQALPAQEPAGGMVNACGWSAMTGEYWSGKRALATFSSRAAGPWAPLLMPDASNTAPKPCPAAGSIHFSPDGGRVWASSKMMFVCVDAKTHALLDISTKHGLKESFEDVLEDKNGIVWVANERGLFQWENGRLESQNHLHPALASGVKQLFCRADGTLAIATKTGLVLWNAGKKAWDLLRERDGLPEDQVGAITEDHQGRLWVGTFSGAAYIALKSDGNWALRRFSKFDGLPSNQVTALAPVDEKIWVGTAAGMAVIHPGQIPALPLVAQPFFTALKINQQWQSRHVFLSGTTLHCSYDQNNLHFEFANLPFQTGNETRFRYRIQADKPWEITLKPEMNLFSLAPGRYQIAVEAADAQGVWGAPCTIDLEIHPPFWQTWWFRLLAAALILVPVVLFYRYRLRVMRAQMNLREQTVELEKQALRAQMDPHFIFNSLNAVQQFILTNDRMKAAAFLSRFANLIRQVLDQSFRSDISLESEIAYLENYLSLEAMRYEGAFQYQIDVDPELETADIRVPTMLVQPFLENAILHGMRGKKGDGHIRLSFAVAGKHDLHILVEDNGAGIQQSSNEKSHQSYGAALAKRRLSLLTTQAGASITLASRQPQGTVVKIALPGVV